MMKVIFWNTIIECKNFHIKSEKHLTHKSHEIQIPALCIFQITEEEKSKIFSELQKFHHKPKVRQSQKLQKTIILHNKV